jgi:hypothetical protein
MPQAATGATLAAAGGRTDERVIVGHAVRWCAEVQALTSLAVGAVLAEQHDDWTEGRRYPGLDDFARSRITLAPATTDATEVTPPATSRRSPN